jgi:solute carrier family 44 (choline transporter-like protein), member 2/4/5
VQLWCISPAVVHAKSGVPRRNAYIMVAVKGRGYCASAALAAQLLLANALRVVAVETIAGALVWLGKVNGRNASGASETHLLVCFTLNLREEWDALLGSTWPCIL